MFLRKGEGFVTPPHPHASYAHERYHKELHNDIYHSVKWFVLALLLFYK